MWVHSATVGETMTNQNQVQAYFQRTIKINSVVCSFYRYPGTRENPGLFCPVCPQFYEARTAAHNQVQKLRRSSRRAFKTDGNSMKSLRLPWPTRVFDSAVYLSPAWRTSGRPLLDHWTSSLRWYAMCRSLADLQC